MPGVSFDIDGDDSSASSEDLRVSNEFDDRYGTTDMLGQHLSYKPVGRLSRWEGNSTNPYSEASATISTYAEDGSQPERFSIIKYLREFFDRKLDCEHITIEDIERVKDMHDRFLHEAQLNFNFSSLLVIASVIAGVGLGSNSSGSIIASMLVSPLMGPVTAIAYGISIGDYKMVRVAFTTELISLSVCIVIGVIIAVCMIQFSVADDWPTDEMTSRGTQVTLYSGIPIAFFSGLGVAVGLLDSQTNSLVGVAISASLLPPAVNAGMLWIIHAYDPETSWRATGWMSLLLTVMNISVIIVASMIMFRLKETLPIEKSIFWSDLGVARKIYHNVAFAPDDQEIRRRVTQFFPRASEAAARNLGIKMDSPTESEDNNFSPVLFHVKEESEEIVLGS